MKREKFPEKVPFRLTRMLVKALGVSGIEGTFRIISEKVMELLRNNKDSLLAILGSFLYDPLISFRLMIPMIMKMKKKGDNYLNDDDIFITEDEMITRLSKSLPLPKISIESLSEILKNKKIRSNYEAKISFGRSSNKDLINEIKNNDEMNKSGESRNDLKFIKKWKINNKKLPIKRETSLKEEIMKTMNNMARVSENTGKDAKKKMEDEQRQIFNLYEENDEIDSEELHQIAQIVLNRINDKLNGMDFYLDHQLDEKEQVDKLIRQATLTENLAQSYLGWCPFW
jgi:FKBP12-rapamycin complex-associated protein